MLLRVETEPAAGERVPAEWEGRLVRNGAGWIVSGDDTGEKEPRDRGLGRDAVDDHHDGWRDQQPQRARTGQGADRQSLVIAALLELRQ